MSRTHEVAWAAGFFDGEGYIVIQKRNHASYTGYYLRIGTNHVAPEPLIEFQRLFGGSIEKQSPEKVIGNRKPRHRWVTSTANAADVLKQLMPFLKNKSKVAALALDFQATIGARGTEVSEEIQAKRAWFKDEITRLNSLD